MRLSCSCVAEEGRDKVFDRLFADDGDPWDLQSSEYERAKRAATLVALGGRRFQAGLEVGCAFGLLTEELAQRCERLLALDVSQTALERALTRLGAFHNVTLCQSEVPSDWPQGQFDCMIWSEVLYFLSACEIRQCSALAYAALLPHGICVLVNWTGENNLPVNGDMAAELFIGHAGWQVVEQQRADRYRLDVLGRKS